MKNLKYNTYNKRIIKTKSWSSESLTHWTSLWQDFSRKKKKGKNYKYVRVGMKKMLAQIL